MAIVPATQFALRFGGIWNNLSLTGATEIYIYSDGVNALPGAYYTGSGYILSAGWHRVQSIHGAFTTPGVPPNPATTDWIRAFNIRTPTAIPTISSVVRSDTTASNILAPFYATVSWSGYTGSGYETTDQIHVTWFQNGGSILSHAVSQGVGSDQSPIVYFHGDTYEVQVAFYDPDSARDGPSSTSGTLIY